MTEQTTDGEYLCDREQRFPFAVLTVWICRFCGELHESVTNWAAANASTLRTGFQFHRR
jgi:hypothetical protein